MNLLEGKVAIITGGSRGIGRAIALSYIKNGSKVILNHTRKGVDIDETKHLLSRYGLDFLIFQGDVRDSQFVRDMVTRVIEKYGRLDILVNNAGIKKDRQLLMMKENDWEEVINIDLKSIYHCSKAVLRRMMDQKEGRIINISSITALEGREGQTNYGAAKAGMIGFTKSLAREVAPYNILVNCVVAGLVDTLMTKTIKRKLGKNIQKKIPLGRFGKPEEIADACLFLASEMSSYITGTTLNVSGGGYM